MIADIGRRAAGDHIDAAQAAQIALIELHIVQHDAAVADPWIDRIAQGLGLVVNFLEHEVRIAALLRSGHLPLDVLGRLAHGRAVCVIELRGVLREHDHIAVVEIHDAARIRQDGRDIRGNEVLSLAEAEDQRTVLLDGDHGIRPVGAEDAERIAALDPAERQADGLHQIVFLFIIVFQQIGNDLRVRLGAERLALLQQELLQRQEILNDAVVHDADAAVCGHLRMRILVRGCAVRRPAGMADAEITGERRAVFRLCAQDGQTALGLGELQLPFRKNTQSSGIIAAILQTGKAVQQNGSCLLRTGITNNSTHKNNLHTSGQIHDLRCRTEIIHDCFVKIN